MAILKLLRALSIQTFKDGDFPALLTNISVLHHILSIFVLLGPWLLVFSFISPAQTSLYSPVHIWRLLLDLLSCFLFRMPDKLLLLSLSFYIGCLIPATIFFFFFHILLQWQIGAKLDTAFRDLTASSLLEIWTGVQGVSWWKLWAKAARQHNGGTTARVMFCPCPQEGAHCLKLGLLHDCSHLPCSWSGC